MKKIKVLGIVLSVIALIASFSCGAKNTGGKDSVSHSSSETSEASSVENNSETKEENSDKWTSVYLPEK